MNNKERVKIFEETLKISKEYFPHIDSRKYNNNIKIIWSENTVKSILEWGGNGRLCALNFADGYEMGGLVWQGVKTQEEDLCRSSNLYLALSAVSYPIDSSLVYSRDVVFFRDDNLELLKEPVICDVVSCPSLVKTSDIGETKRRMRMIIESAKINGAEMIILGKWGCGAFGNDWGVFKKLWDEVIEELGCAFV